MPGGIRTSASGSARGGYRAAEKKDRRPLGQTKYFKYFDQATTATNVFRGYTEFRAVRPEGLRNMSKNTGHNKAATPTPNTSTTPTPNTNTNNQQQQQHGSATTIATYNNSTEGTSATTITSTTGFVEHSRTRRLDDAYRRSCASRMSRATAPDALRFRIAFRWASSAFSLSSSISLRAIFKQG